MRLSSIKFLARLSSLVIPVVQMLLILLNVSAFFANIIPFLAVDVAAIWLSQLSLHQEAVERDALEAAPGRDVRIVIPDPDGNSVSEVVWATRVGGERPGYRLANQPLNLQYDWGEVVQAEPFIMSDQAHKDITSVRRGKSGRFSFLASVFGKGTKIVRRSPTLLTVPAMNPAKDYQAFEDTDYDDYDDDE